MLTREEMHNLVQGIIGGHEARTAGIADLYEEVGEYRSELDRTHRAMARQLRTGLARERAALTPQEAERKAEVHAWMGQVATEHDGARQEWRRLTLAGAKR